MKKNSLHFLYHPFSIFFLSLVLSYLCFYFYQPQVIAVEALNYGNIPIAIIDNLVNLQNIHLFQNFQREGAEFLTFPFTTIFFMFFGESYESLFFTFIFLSSLWFLTWYIVGRELLPPTSQYILFIVFLIALPIAHIISLDIQMMAVHQGASTFIGLSFLCLLKIKNKSFFYKYLLLLLSSLFSFLAFFYGLISIPLIIGILCSLTLLGLKEKKLAQYLSVWIFGFFIQFIIFYQYIDFSFLGFFVESSGIQASFGLKDKITTSIQTTINLFVYFGGLLKFHHIELAKQGNTIFSLLNIIYPFILATLLMLYLKNKKGIYQSLPSSPISKGMLLSSLSLFMAIIFSPHGEIDGSNEYNVMPNIYDGLRYVTPLVPFYLIGITYLFSKLWQKKVTKVIFYCYITIGIYSFIPLLYPFNISRDETSNVRGFNLIFQLKNPQYFINQDLSSVSDKRIAFYSFNKGRIFVSCYPSRKLLKKIEGFIQKVHKNRAPSIAELATNEFYRGLGLQSHLYQTKNKKLIQELKGFENKVFQGIGMSFILKASTPNLEKELANQYRSQLEWGVGRSSQWTWPESFEEKIKYRELNVNLNSASFESGRSKGLKLDFSRDVQKPAKITDLYFDEIDHHLGGKGVDNKYWHLCL